MAEIGKVAKIGIGEGIGRERRGSTGNIEELFKRKRDLMERGEEQEMAFRVGKKVQRSPQAGTREKAEEEKSWMNEIKEEWKIEMREGIKEVKEIVKEQGRETRKELEEMRKQLRDREERWEKEKKEMEKRIVEMENRLENMKMQVEGKKGEREVRGGELEERVKGIERMIEMREREERRRNIVIKGIKGGERG